MRAIELFAGAGGLALGAQRAGFDHPLVAEWNHNACETIRANQALQLPLVKDWRLKQCDVRGLDYFDFADNIDVVAGGPPCQPFSIAGKHAGFDDSRDMFPEAVRAVRETRPTAFVFENVKGLLRKTFSTYFAYILLQLEFPMLARRPTETWPEHLKRLERHKTSGAESDLRYKVLFRLLNAADFGVPQRRERVFIVGIRSGTQIDWSFPDPTHSEAQLEIAKWVDQSYWERHRVARARRPQPPTGFDYGRALERARPLLRLRRWETVRDAISDLPPPAKHASRRVRNHVYVPGARTYKGHTGSPLDEPAKTLKAGDHGVPGGENMIVLDTGDVRYFTVREAARLQTFPDDYVFATSWTENMRQLGNAVPVELAAAVFRSLRNALSQNERKP